MDITTIDIAIVGVILFLSFKGLIGGFVRELFSALGVLIGIYSASHFSEKLSIVMHDRVLETASLSTLKAVSFIIILSGVWWVISIVGKLVLSTINSDSPTLISRVGGYIITVGKYFMIFSLIVYVLMHSPVIKKKSFGKKIVSASIYPYMSEVGGWLLNAPKIKISSSKSGGKN